MAARETKQNNKEKALHKVTAAERTAVDKHFARREAKPSVRLKVFKNGSEPQIGFDHPDEQIGQLLIMEALASPDADFANGILSQLANASERGRDIDEQTLNFMLSVIKGIEPRNQLEAMLAAQMAAVHVASMTFARRLIHVETISQQDSAERALNKLTRTFAMQMEAHLQIAPILGDLESYRRLRFTSGKMFVYCGAFRRRHLMDRLLFSVLLLRLSC